MATIALLVANSTKTSGTTLDATVPAGGVAVGTVLSMRAAWDNDTTGTTSPSPTGSVTDSRSNTWTKRGERGSGSASGAGVVGALFTTTLTTALQAGDFIRLTTSASVAARAISVATVVGAAPNTSITVQTANGVSTTPSVSITPTASGQTVLGMVAREDNTAGGYTQDSDTTQGSWIGLTVQGTTGGNAQTNVTVGGAYKDVTGTSAQTYNPTIDSTDWVAIAMVFDAVAINWTATITDALGTVDAVAASTTTVATEALGLTGSVGGTLTGDYDPLGLVDSVSSALGGGGTDHTAATTDALGATDAAAIAVGYATAITNALGLDDPLDGELRGEYEILGLVDTTATEQSVVFADALGGLDDVAGLVSTQATITDALGSIDAVVAESASTAVASDLLGATDAVALAVDAQRVVSDGMGSVDNVASLADGGQAVTDALGLTDLVAQESSAQAVFTDSAGMVDSVSAEGALAGLVTDGVGLLDATSQQGAAVVDITDLLGLTDQANPDGALTLSDALGLSSSVAGVLTGGYDLLGLVDTVVVSEAVDQTATVTDALGVVDVTVAAGAFSQTVGDLVAGVDSVQIVDGSFLSDAVALDDDVAGTLTGDYDPLGMTDSVTTGSGAAQTATATDAVGLSDAVTIETGGLGAATLGEAVGLDDSLVGILTGSYDPLGLTDSITTSNQLDHARTVGETLGITDTGQPATLDVADTLTEALGASDAVASTRGVTTSTTDTLGLVDSSATGVVYTATVTDALGVVDAPAPAHGWAALAADLVGALDTAASSSSFSPGVSDTASLSDNLAFSLQSDGSVLFVDPLSLGDELTVVLTAERTIVDVEGLPDSVLRSQDRDLNDQASIGDAPAQAAGVVRDTAEPCGLTDGLAVALAGATTVLVTDPLAAADSLLVEQVTLVTQVTVTDALGSLDARVAVASYVAMLTDAMAGADGVAFGSTAGHIVTRARRSALTRLRAR